MLKINNSIAWAGIALVIFAIAAAAGVVIISLGFYNMTVQCKSGKFVTISYDAAIKGGSTTLKGQCNK